MSNWIASKFGIYLRKGGIPSIFGDSQRGVDERMLNLC